MPNRDSRPTPVTISLHTDGGSLSWVLSEIGEETLEGTVNISSGKILGKGKLPIPQRPTKLSGVSGLPGAVLPKGRLAALVRAVTEPGQKDTLCWAVLRRYANWYGCYPKPPHRVRKQAYEVIRRAWIRADLPLYLQNPPTGFWSADVPPGDGINWPVTESLTLGFGTLPIRITFTHPLDELLNPD